MLCLKMVETQRRERTYSSACKTVSIRACMENWEEKEDGNEWVERRLLNTGSLVPITIFYTLRYFRIPRLLAILTSR